MPRCARRLARLADTVPILDRQIDRMNRLDAKGYAPGQRLLEMERQRRQEVGERDVAVTQISRGQSEARKLDQQIRETREQALRTALADLAKAEGEAVLRREEVTKARQMNCFQRLVAPVDGTVQQMDVHTIGGVVEAAKPLMTVVPSRGALEVQARVLNKDIGFIREGQDASVKLEGFSGSPVTARCPAASPGSAAMRCRTRIWGLVYIATISLDRSFCRRRRAAVRLGAGTGRDGRREDGDA